MSHNRLLGAVAAAGLILGATSAAHADADAYLFAYTYSPYVYGPQELIINGSTTIQAYATGWYDYTGSHDSANPDYIVGNCSLGSCGGDASYNDFFTFDLSGVSGPITSATLSLGNPSVGYSGASTATFTTYDVSTPIDSVTASQSGAVSIYNDLGSGTSYGAVGVGPFDNNGQVDIVFNSAGLTALSAAEGGEFAVGGSLGVFSGGVPEPATWATMLLGMGLMGAVFRRRPREARAV
jgi:hypothetical protein